MDLPPQELILAAQKALANAYAPFSHFRVGAALLAEGELFTGCNIENVSYGLTMCAERVAVGAAVAAGHTRFEAIAIASSRAAPPCGACRQVLAEFEPSLAVFLVQAGDASFRQVSLADLLPDAFSAGDLD